jgi:magnesium-transporting ATPase (P-type)
MPVAQPYEERVENDISFSGTSRCVVNGKEVPCEDVIEGAKTGFKIFGSVILFIVVFGIACFVFWIWMFVHAISKPIQNKVVWIICFILFGIVTAIVYYFAVKRSYVSPVPQAQVAYTPSHTPEVPPSAP